MEPLHLYNTSCLPRKTGNEFHLADQICQKLLHWWRLSYQIKRCNRRANTHFFHVWYWDLPMTWHWKDQKILRFLCLKPIKTFALTFIFTKPACVTSLVWIMALLATGWALIASEIDLGLSFFFVCFFVGVPLGHSYLKPLKLKRGISVWFVTCSLHSGCMQRPSAGRESSCLNLS